MNLLHLEYFYNVAREGGFMKAAQKLRIQQPAISRMVARLEETLGFKLFEKVGRHVRLTLQGEAVYEASKKIFHEVDVLKASLGEISSEVKGPLRLGASDAIASHYLPTSLAQLMRLYPGLYPIVFSGTASSLLDSIEGGDLELGMFFYLPQLSQKLKVVHTIKIPFRLVVHKNFKKNTEVLSRFIGSREVDDLSVKSFPTFDRLKKLYPKAALGVSSNNLGAHKA